MHQPVQLHPRNVRKKRVPYPSECHGADGYAMQQFTPTSTRVWRARPFIPVRPSGAQARTTRDGKEGIGTCRQETTLPPCARQAHPHGNGSGEAGLERKDNRLQNTVPSIPRYAYGRNHASERRVWRSRLLHVLPLHPVTPPPVLPERMNISSPSAGNAPKKPLRTVRKLGDSRENRHNSSKASGVKKSSMICPGGEGPTQIWGPRGSERTKPPHMFLPRLASTHVTIKHRLILLHHGLKKQG